MRSEGIVVPTGTEKKIESSISISNLVSKEHKLYHLFNFIGNNYGENPENILRALTPIFDFDKGLRSFFSSEKKFSFKNTFNLLRYTLPATLYGAEMIFKTKKYIKKIKEGELSEYDKRQIKIKELLGLDPNKGMDYWNSIYITDEILEWLLKSPKTTGYKVLGYHDASSFELLDKIPTNTEIHLYISFEYNEKKFLLEVETKTFGSVVYLDELRFMGESPSISKKVVKAIEMLIIKDFILTFNIKENILEFKGNLISRKRTKVVEKINQYNINPLIKEIRKVLRNGRKRGRGFIGRQGTGKTIIIKKLEEILTDIIIFKIGPEEFGSSSSIKRCFSLIKTIQPALVVIEDLDAFGFKEKNERVATFINEIDDTNNDLNIFLLVTINDPDMVHRTIIDRPGRFDEIDEIKSPQSSKEIYEVMKSNFGKLKHFYNIFENTKFPKQKDIDSKLFDKCLNNGFTQAELTSGIIEKIFINVDDPKNMDFNKEMEKAIESFEKSKMSLKTYSFNEEEFPIEQDEDLLKEEAAVTEEPELTADPG